MRHHIFDESESYRVGLLFKATSFNKEAIKANYTTTLNANGVNNGEMIAFTLKYEDTGKASIKFMKKYLELLLPELQSLGITHLYVADAQYFKLLTKQNKADPHLGYVLPCLMAGYEHMQVVLGLNYQALIYNPELKDKLNLSLTTLSDSLAGKYVAIGGSIIHSAQYPESLADIAAALESLHQYPHLTCDIETRSLRFHEAGIETIAFAWDKHNGIAFCVDKNNTLDDALKIKRLLKEFFTSFKGKLIYHNASFDVQILVYELWMKAV